MIDPRATTIVRAEQAEALRSTLRGLAYRMVSSMSDADDLVQDAIARFITIPEVEHPRAYLTQMVTRLCMDHLKSARVRREAYVGPWLPEPVAEADVPSAPSHTELAADISFALLLTLERLSPLERAAFLLHDVFDYEFSEIASILGRQEDACRQLARRARQHVATERPRFQPARHDRDALARAFFAAATQGDRQALTDLLATQAELVSDSGGKRPAALRVLVGVDRIARFFQGIHRRWPVEGRCEEVIINGELGLFLRDRDGGCTTLSLEVGADRVQRVFVTRNPEKLERFADLRNAARPDDPPRES